MAKLVTKPCAYCDSTGQVDVGTFVPDERCPVCKENREVRVPSNYTKCQICDGTGKEDVGEFVQRLVRCKNCLGTECTSSCVWMTVSVEADGYLRPKIEILT